jgi:hypothetical protein
MPQTSIFHSAINVGDLKIGIRVRHLGRLDLGEGRVKSVYPEGYCDVEFADCSFSWIPAAVFCPVDIFEREKAMQEEALVRRREWEQAQEIQAREREKKRLARLDREEAARNSLFGKLRANRRFNDADLALLRSLPELDRLKLFTSLNDLGFVMDELLLLLRQGSTDGTWKDALNVFWRARSPTAECVPLTPLAPPWWKERLWRNIRYALLPLPGRLEILSGATLQLSRELRNELIQEIVREHSSGQSFGEVLRQTPLRLRLELLAALRSDMLRSFESLALQALSESATADPGTLPSHLIDEFWARHEASILRRSPLFQVAPSQVQRKILQRHYHRHIEQLDRLFQHNRETSGDWHASVVYQELDAGDEELATLWSADTATEHETARMLSARAAEKVAGWFYLHLGFGVTDVAMHQLSGRSDQWKTHDLVLNGSKPVDVKNARLPVHNKAFYVEHTVPRFKKDRADRNVTIAAVVSPYLSLRYLRDPDRADFEVSDVRFLGETNLETIRRICHLFSGSALVVSEPAHGAFVPPWYFDFPNAWFREFDKGCSQLRQDASPDEFESQLLYEDRISAFPLPQYIAARLALPAWLLDSMAPWMRTFAGQLQEACKPRAKLAHLFLLLLTDFLGRIRRPPVIQYEPSSYLTLLFQTNRPTGDIAGRRPLGIEDPLGTISTLCESLQQLWTAREHLTLERFTEYRLSGGGILQGRERQGHPWETVLAYCGGFVEGKGRCGCAPLVLGRERQCPVCRKLICNECGYCSEGCATSADGAD